MKLQQANTALEVYQEKIRKLDDENTKLEASIAQEEQQFAKLQFAQHTNEAIMSELRKNLDLYNSRVAQSMNIQQQQQQLSLAHTFTYDLL